MMKVAVCFFCLFDCFFPFVQYNSIIWFHKNGCALSQLAIQLLGKCHFYFQGLIKNHTHTHKYTHNNNNNNNTALEFKLLMKWNCKGTKCPFAIFPSETELIYEITVIRQTTPTIYFGIHSWNDPLFLFSRIFSLCSSMWKQCKRIKQRWTKGFHFLMLYKKKKKKNSLVAFSILNQQKQVKCCIQGVRQQR